MTTRTVTTRRPAPSTPARITELELRFLELQRDVDTLSDIIREMDARLALLTDKLDRAIAQTDDPINPEEHGPFDTRW